MKLDRSTLVSLGLVALTIAAGIVIGLAVAGDKQEQLPRLAGRIAVRDGCGLLHMWPDGTDQRHLCLNDMWASASLSLDGSTLAWDSKAKTTYGILLGNADGSGEYVLQVPDGTNVEPTVSANGKRLAFLHSPSDDGRYNVWTTTTSSSADAAEQVTTSRDVSDVALSPAGDWLAYVRGWSPETLEGEIFLVKPSGEGERLLGRGDSPAWSPDGKRLALVRGGDIWIVNFDGSGERRLVSDGREPGWSRNGTQIAFLREERCGKAVCKERVNVLSADGGTAKAVGPRFSGDPTLLWLADPFE